MLLQLHVKDLNYFTIALVLDLTVTDGIITSIHISCSSACAFISLRLFTKYICVHMHMQTLIVWILYLFGNDLNTQKGLGWVYRMG